MSTLRRRAALLLALAVLLSGRPGALGAAEVPSRTVDAPLDRVWTVTESVLESLGWKLDTFDRAVGWLVTDSRPVDYKNYAVYGKGLRHRLRLALKAAGAGRTTVSVERELYTEERILWMTERRFVPPTDQTVETGILDAIERRL
jgi:hypothetical protein